MTTEDLMKLADAYANAQATFKLEDLYGTSKGYTAQCKSFADEARAKLLDALEALGREVAELKLRAGNGFSRKIEELIAERDQARAELAAIRATDKDAGLVADGYPCEIEEADFEKNTITIKMMTSNYQVSAGKYLLKEEPKIGGV